MTTKHHNRKSLPLKPYDYSLPGIYFITICTHQMKCIFEEIIEKEMRLNELGEIVREQWIRTELLRKNIILDKYTIMPNHFHAIINICTGTARRAPTITMHQFGKPTKGSLSTIIRSFKSAVTKEIRKIRKTPNQLIWQRNYYEHIVRNENLLADIQQYIINNPLKWAFDRNHPNNIKRQTP